MANVIKLKKGLNIHLAGKAAEEVFVAKASKVYGGVRTRARCFCRCET